MVFENDVNRMPMWRNATSTNNAKFRLEYRVLLLGASVSTATVSCHGCTLHSQWFTA